MNVKLMFVIRLFYLLAFIYKFAVFKIFNYINIL